MQDVDAGIPMDVHVIDGKEHNKCFTGKFILYKHFV